MTDNRILQLLREGGSADALARAIEADPGPVADLLARWRAIEDVSVAPAVSGETTAQVAVELGVRPVIAELLLNELRREMAFRMFGQGVRPAEVVRIGVLRSPITAVSHHAAWRHEMLPRFVYLLDKGTPLDAMPGELGVSSSCVEGFHEEWLGRKGRTGAAWRLDAGAWTSPQESRVAAQVIAAWVAASQQDHPSSEVTGQLAAHIQTIRPEVYVEPITQVGERERRLVWTRAGPSWIAKVLASNGIDSPAPEGLTIATRPGWVGVEEPGRGRRTVFGNAPPLDRVFIPPGDLGRLRHDTRPRSEASIADFLTTRCRAIGPDPVTVVLESGRTVEVARFGASDHQLVAEFLATARDQVSPSARDAAARIRWTLEMHAAEFVAPRQWRRFEDLLAAVIDDMPPGIGIDPATGRRRWVKSVVLSEGTLDGLLLYIARVTHVATKGGWPASQTLITPSLVTIGTSIDGRVDVHGNSGPIGALRIPELDWSKDEKDERTDMGFQPDRETWGEYLIRAATTKVDGTAISAASVLPPEDLANLSPGLEFPADGERFPPSVPDCASPEEALVAADAARALGDVLVAFILYRQALGGVDGWQSYANAIVWLDAQRGTAVDRLRWHLEQRKDYSTGQSLRVDASRFDVPVWALADRVGWPDMLTLAKAVDHQRLGNAEQATRHFCAHLNRVCPGGTVEERFRALRIRMGLADPDVRVRNDVVTERHAVHVRSLARDLGVRPEVLGTAEQQNTARKVGEAIRLTQRGLLPTARLRLWANDPGTVPGYRDTLKARVLGLRDGLFRLQTELGVSERAVRNIETGETPAEASGNHVPPPRRDRGRDRGPTIRLVAAAVGISWAMFQPEPEVRALQAQSVLRGTPLPALSDLPQPVEHVATGADVATLRGMYGLPVVALARGSYIAPTAIFVAEREPQSTVSDNTSQKLATFFDLPRPARVVAALPSPRHMEQGGGAVGSEPRGALVRPAVPTLVFTRSEGVEADEGHRPGPPNTASRERGAQPALGGDDHGKRIGAPETDGEKPDAPQAGSKGRPHRLTPKPKNPSQAPSGPVPKPGFPSPRSPGEGVR